MNRSISHQVSVNISQPGGVLRAVRGEFVWIAAVMMVLAQAAGLTAAPQLDTPVQETWVTDGTVYAVVEHEGVVYLGGDFSNVSPNTGGGTEPRNRLAALDAETGTLLPWDPGADNTVRALAVSGATVYAGGDFTSIGGENRDHIAAIDTNTGNAIAWDHDANNTVYALTVLGSTVYAGGDFSSIGGESRSRIAALDATTGDATAWNPGANDRVWTLTTSDATVYAGGWFTNIGGEARSRIAALDATTGDVTPWNPGANAGVLTLAVSGTTVYAGGSFGNVDGEPRLRIAAIDATTGDVTPWNPSANLTVWDLAVSGSTVYAGGIFSGIGGESRDRIAALDATTGNATAWNPGANDRIRAITVSDATVYVGGDFTNIGGEAREGIAAFMPPEAQEPVAPIVTNPTLTTLDVIIGAGDGNLPTTEYAIHHENTTSWVQEDGSLDTSPDWQTATDWGATTVTGLSGATLHSFVVRARNSPGTESDDGPAASAGTNVLLSYTAGPNGSINGQTPQEVAYNGDGTQVEAAPDTGYHFVDWSDGVMTAARTDTEVTENISVTANFADITPPTSAADADAIQVGGDITGTYTASDDGSGVDFVELYVREPGSAWTNAGTVTGGTWSYTPTETGDAADGLYRFATVATDNAANTQTAPSGSDTGDASVLYNNEANSNFAWTFEADGTGSFPMTNDVVIEIELADVTDPVTITVSRTPGNNAPVGFSAERLINEFLTITGDLDGATATLTWNFDPSSTDAPGFVATLNTVFQFDGATQIGQYPVTPSGNTLVVGPITSLSDWYAGSNDATTPDWTLY